MEKGTVKISVREIVEFILRYGDIDSGYMSAKRMQDGIKIHQKIQKKRKKQAEKAGMIYESEYKLSTSVNFRGFDIVVEGRADGVFFNSDNTETAVEEIKSTLGNVFENARQLNPLHIAQLKFYGYMLCKAENFQNVCLRLLYCHVETLECEAAEEVFSFEELSGFFLDTVEKYAVWLEMDWERKKVRNESIKKEGFPHRGYRVGQREFAVLAYRAFQNNKNLFIEAPTGTGKTISALFPAVKALGEGISDKIFYLTAKTITRQAAEGSVDLLCGKGFLVNSLTLTAKDKICRMEESICTPSYCPYARGHFDRVNDAVWDIVKHEKSIRRQNITEYSDKHMVCPHEFALDVSFWVDIIICDYNYAFDPKVSLKRFFGENASSGNFVFLIDEAHNLVERSREMFSAELGKKEFFELRKLIKERYPASNIYKTLGKINTYFLEAGKNIRPDKKIYSTKLRPESLETMLLDFSEFADAILKQTSQGQESSDKEFASDFLAIFFKVLDFLRAYEFFDEKYSYYVQKKSSDVIVKLFCMDPSYLLAKALKKSSGAVFFSATLTPLDYFCDVLGGSGEDLKIRLSSPFDPDNLRVIAEPRISTRYKNREDSYESISKAIKSMCDAKKGNYFAFFPSYDYMEKVHAVFVRDYNDFPVVIQGRSLNEEEREDFLNCFKENSEGFLAFAVMGGIFSEGIDLVADKLIGAAIIGVGLPLVTEERDLLLEYYNEREDSNFGFEYAYMYPGMNKVLQAAGRVIRSETDRGVILLIDDRFATFKYTSLFPKHWAGFLKATGDSDLTKLLKNYWVT